MTDLLGPASAPGSVTTRPTEARTFGVTDSWFKDCTDEVLNDGTAYEASFFNALLANLRSVVRGNGQTALAADVVTQDNSSDDLIWRACQHLYQRGQPAYADDTGIANQVIIALSPAPAELKKGMQVRVKIAADNGGASTLTCNATVKDIKTVAGQPLAKGMLVAGQMANFEYDGTAWQLTSVWSEKVVFTPVATINCASIGSLAHATWTQHNNSLGSAANIVPVVNSNDFRLPDGKYLFALGSLGVTHNNVNNITQIAQGLRINVNGSPAQSDLETTHLLAGQNATTFPQVTAVLTVASTDVLAIASYAACTALADFSSAASAGAIVNVVRLGN